MKKVDLVFVIILLVLILILPYAVSVEKSWGEMNSLERGDLIKSKGVKSIDGDLSGVSFDGDNALTNGGVKLLISDAQGLDVEVLKGGGFKITKPENIEGNRFENVPSVEYSKNGFTFQDGIMEDEFGRKIISTGSEEITIKSSKNTMSISGTAEIDTGDGRVVSGKDLNVHFSQDLPAINALPFDDGNHVYLTPDRKFALKGNVELSEKTGDVTDRYKGEHEKTVIWRNEGNVIHVENSEEFATRNTVARSWHEVAVQNEDTNDLTKVEIQNRYVSKENKILILSKATDLGKLGDVSKENIVVVPDGSSDVIIDVGDGFPFSLNDESLRKRNVFGSFELEPYGYSAGLETPSKYERDRGKVAKLVIKRSFLGASEVEIFVDESIYNELLNKYKNYKGPDEERNVDFISDLVFQNKGRISMKVSLPSAIKFFSFGIADSRVRDTMINVGRDSGLEDLPDDWKEFVSLVNNYESGQTIILESNGNGPVTMSIIDNNGNQKFPTTMSQEAIRRIRQKNFLKFLNEETLKPKFQKLANEHLE